MRTKQSIFTLISMLILIFVGCGEEDLVNKELQDLDMSYLKNYEFIGSPPVATFKKSGKRVTREIIFFETEGPMAFDYEVDGCAPAPYVTVTGEGNASLIGHYSVENRGCYDGISPIFGVITAANGDEIHTYIATAEQDPVSGIWTYHYIVYGGTGRFMEAEGDIFMFGITDFVNMIWNLEGEGMITF